MNNDQQTAITLCNTRVAVLNDDYSIRYAIMHGSIEREGGGASFGLDPAHTPCK